MQLSFFLSSVHHQHLSGPGVRLQLLMVATFIAGCCTKLSKEQNVEECDATGFNSSNTVWLITKTYDLNTVPINMLDELQLTTPTHGTLT